MNNFNAPVSMLITPFLIFTQSKAPKKLKPVITPSQAEEGDDEYETCASADEEVKPQPKKVSVPTCSNLNGSLADVYLFCFSSPSEAHHKTTITEEARRG